MTYFDALETHGSSVALVSAQETLTYAELAARADRIGEHIPRRSLVCILATNTVGAISGYAAALRRSAPVLMLAANLAPELLTSLLAAYRPQYIWAPAGSPAAAPIAPEARPVLEQDGYVLLDTGSEPVEAHADLALLMTTSGSTGSPKFVRQTYANLCANACSIAEYLELTPESRPITTLPMSYVYGLSVINSHLQAGAPLILTNAGIMEKAFWDMLKEHGATSIAGVPYTYEMLRQLHFSRMKLPALKVLTQAGGKLNAELVSEFATLCRDKGMHFYVMYGAAEATSRMGYLPAALATAKPSSIGIPIPGGTYWLEEDDGSRIEGVGAVGELVYTGPNVVQGYATCREDLARGDEKGGVHRTGDLAWRDEEGLYYIAGRKRGFIKIFGNRVNMEELEQHVRKAGVDCACDGEDDRLRIYITEPDKAAWVKDFVHRLTGLHPSAFHPVVIEAIPRNASGKILYAALPKP